MLFTHVYRENCQKDVKRMEYGKEQCGAAAYGSIYFQEQFERIGKRFAYSEFGPPTITKLIQRESEKV